MPQSGESGSVRGAASNGRPYRDRGIRKSTLNDPRPPRRICPRRIVASDASHSVDVQLGSVNSVGRSGDTNTSMAMQSYGQPCESSVLHR